MIVAGEASGDLHGSNLVLAARELVPELDFFGMGGQRLRAAGVDLAFDLEHMSLMGFTEIISKLGYAWSALKTLKAAMAETRPAGLVLIDYPDFNLSLAKTAKKLGVPVFYYISPQIWAWRTGRVRKMARLVDKLVVVFPFETEFYRRHGVEAVFAGHPLLDIMPPPKAKNEAKAHLGFDPDKPLLVLFPGSRRPLVRQLLPVLLQAAEKVRDRRPDLALAVAQADTLTRDFLASFLKDGPGGVEVLAGRPHSLQNAADVAVVASGTSTLETALMLTPMVVVYRTHPLTYHLARFMLKTKDVAMANLIAGRRVVPELLQNEVCPDRIAAELERILGEPEKKEEMTRGLRQVRGRLGEPGASRRAARLLLQTIGLDPGTRSETDKDEYL